MTEVAAAYVSIEPEISRSFRRTVVTEASTTGDQAATSFGNRFGARTDADGKRIGRGFGKAFGVAAVAAAGVAFAAGNFLKGAISSAGDLEQSVGAIDTIFGKSSKKMHRWGKDAAQAVGLSRNEFNELGTLIGAQLKNGGTAMDQLAPKTHKLIRLGADLSSMFGGTSREAIEALSSALKGERDPIERYGVSLNQAKIDAEAAALGFKKVGGSLSAEANQAATLSLIMKQTADAHGNFAKESGTLQGQQQRLGAQWDDMKTKLGTKLLPIATDFVTFLNQNMGPAFTRITGFVRPLLADLGAKFGPILAQVMTALTPVVTAIAGFFTNLESGKGILGEVQSTFSTVFTSIQSIVTSSITIVTQLWKLFGDNILNSLRNTFSNVLQLLRGVVNVVAGVFKVIASILTGDWKGAWDGVKQIAKGAVQIVVGLVKQLWNTIKTAFTSGVIAAKAAFTGLWEAVKAGGSKVIGWFTKLPGKVTGALGDVGSMLLQAGKDILQGLWNGLKDKWESIKGWLGDKAADIKNAITKPLKVFSPSRVMIQVGQFIMDGLRNGLRKGFDGVDAVMAKVGDKLATFLDKKKIGKKVSAKATRIFDSISAAGQKVTDALAARSDLAGSVASNLMGEFDLGSIFAKNDFGLSQGPANAVAAAQGIVARIRGFASKLTRLIAAGLPGNLVKEVASLGSVEGARVADVLLQGGNSAIGSIRSAYNDFQSIVSGIGFDVANAAAGQDVADAQAAFLAAIVEGLSKLGLEITVGIGDDTSMQIVDKGTKRKRKRK